MSGNNYSDIHERSLATESSTPKTGPKQIILSNIYRLLDIPLNQFEHGQKRDVYFCSLYRNTREYLTDQLNSGLSGLFDEKHQNKLLSKRVEDIYDEVLEEEKQKKWGKKKIRARTAKKRAKKITHDMNHSLHPSDNGYESNISDQWWDWWLNKATSRYETLVDEDRYEEDQLFYDPVPEQIDKIDQWLGSRGRKKMDFSDFKM